jgi:hypothetical protein
VAATQGGHNEDGRTESIGVTKHASNLNALDPTLKYHWLELSERTEYVGTGRDIFRAEIPVLRIPTKGPKPPVHSRFGSGDGDPADTRPSPMKVALD